MNSQGSQNLYLSGDSDVSFLIRGSARGARSTTGRIWSSGELKKKTIKNTALPNHPTNSF